MKRSLKRFSSGKAIAGAHRLRFDSRHCFDGTTLIYFVCPNSQKYSLFVVMHLTFVTLN